PSLSTPLSVFRTLSITPSVTLVTVLRSSSPQPELGILAVESRPSLTALKAFLGSSMKSVRVSQASSSQSFAPEAFFLTQSQAPPAAEYSPPGNLPPEAKPRAFFTPPTPPDRAAALTESIQPLPITRSNSGRMIGSPPDRFRRMPLTGSTKPKMSLPGVYPGSMPPLQKSKEVLLMLIFLAPTTPATLS